MPTYPLKLGLSATVSKATTTGYKAHHPALLRLDHRNGAVKLAGRAFHDAVDAALHLRRSFIQSARNLLAYFE
jgi:hypothetical protein